MVTPLHSKAETDRILSETGITVSELASRIPGTGLGSRINTCTVTRWIMRGVLGPDGNRVCLEAAKIGGKWVTSLEAYERFVAATTNHSVPPAGDAIPADISRSQCHRTPTERQKASVLAATELARRGA
ncbi:MAG: DUF1580 domain-containing protein [Planctomycetes bacterium]|nr:DUF1580 domain-containing protein [Planctomycetota bacterium]